MKKVVAIIPARFDSRRFPGKVLYPLNGKPLLQHLYQSVSKSPLISKTIIASDSPKIIEAAQSFGAEVIKTSKRHKTGSDRLAECQKKIKADIYLNIQGDTVNLKASLLNRLIESFVKLKSYDFGTVAVKIDSDDDLFDPHTVKVVLGKNKDALMFSRFPLPFLQNAFEGDRHTQFKFYRHLGIYLFTSKGLKKYSSWTRSPLEKAESLEQLRILDNNEKIRVFETKHSPVSIDVKNDLKKIENIYK